MNYSQILKQAWHNVRHYRALWVFGIILALVTLSWETAALFNRNDQGQPPGINITRRSNETFGEAAERAFKQRFDQIERDLNEFLSEALQLEVESDLSTLITALFFIAMFLFVAGRVARYVSEAALIRMVDREQETGQQQSFRQGLRLGWSRCAWRFFFIELLINLVTIAASLLLFALIFSPLPLWVQGSEGTIIVFAFLTAALLMLAIFVVIVAAVAVTLLKIFARNACALEGLGVVASVYRGYTLLRQNFKRVLPLGLIGLAVNAGWPVLLGISSIILFGMGILVGGLPALLLYWLLGLVMAGETPLFIAIGFGVVVGFLILIAPLAWLGGLRQVFVSSMWTLAYRELCQLEQEALSTPPEVLLPDAPPPDWVKAD